MDPIERRSALHPALEAVRLAYNQRELVHPDPLEFLYNYSSWQDREIVGLIASSLAYGNVKQILSSVAKVLRRLASPRDFLETMSDKAISNTFDDFKHRFTTAKQMAALLLAAKRAIHKHGSLKNCFLSGHRPEHETVLPALSAFSDSMGCSAKAGGFSLIPSPEDGSACKRANLFLRWMVRCDQVDLGDWPEISPSKLIVPLDTHLYRIGLKLGFTKRKQADLRAALEITEAFRQIAPDDPIRYDFSLTRFGIRKEGSVEDFLERWKSGRAA